MTESMKDYIDLMVDYAFKYLLGSEHNKEILIQLLNDTIYFFEKEKVTDITHLNPEMLVTDDEDKKAVMDVKILARMSNGEEHYINIEVQRVSTSDYPDRTLYYTSNIYSSQLKKGDDYKSIKKVKSLNLIGDKLIKDTEDFYTNFKLRSEKGILMTDSMIFYFIELDKVDNKKIGLNNRLDLWAYLFKNSRHIDPTNPPKEYLKHKVFVDLFKEMEKMIKEAEPMAIYNRRRDLLQEHEKEVKMARKDGIEIGEEIGERKGIKIGEEIGERKGIKIGEEIGERKGIRKTAKNLKNIGVNIKAIVEATGLTKEEIETL